MTKGTLLASSGTPEGITKCINIFYYGTEYRVLDTGLIKRLSDGKILDNVIVIKCRGRYRFQTLEKL